MKKLFALLALSLPLLAQPAPPDQPDLTLDAKTRTAVIDRALSLLDQRYVFPEKATAMADPACR